MRVGTITTHTAHNYGATLQAYALCEFINQQGHACEIIDYRPVYSENNYRILKPVKSFQDCLVRGYQLMHYSARKKRYDKFISFQKSMMKLSKKSCRDLSDLKDINMDYDVMVCGSDQIWSPELHEFDEAYFLTYRDDTVTPIGYAPSFGMDVLPTEYNEEIMRRIEGFHHLAFREYTGQEIIKTLLGRDVPIVLDPTFLLNKESWENISSPRIIKEKYVLMYFLSNPGKAAEIAYKKAIKEGYKVVSIGFSPRNFMKPYKKRYDLGPLDFLSYIQNAEYIVTNSFHGTALSIIFNKNFYVRINRGTKTRNNRIVTLLNELDLTGKMFFDDESNSIDYHQKIDYMTVNGIRNRLTESSKNFLIKALEETKQNKTNKK